MRRRTFLAIFVALLGSSACATGGAPSQGSSRNADLITAEELRSVASFTAYDAVRRLRPAWFRYRGGSPPVVFVDGVRMGGPDVLHDYRATQFVEMRHRSGPDATTLYGTGVGGGTIELRTRAR